MLPPPRVPHLGSITTTSPHLHCCSTSAACGGDAAGGRHSAAHRRQPQRLATTAMASAGAGPAAHLLLQHGGAAPGAKAPPSGGHHHQLKGAAVKSYSVVRCAGCNKTLPTGRGAAGSQTRGCVQGDHTNSAAPAVAACCLCACPAGKRLGANGAAERSAAARD